MGDRRIGRHMQRVVFPPSSQCRCHLSAIRDRPARRPRCDPSCRSSRPQPRRPRATARVELGVVRLSWLVSVRNSESPISCPARRPSRKALGITVAAGHQLADVRGVDQDSTVAARRGSNGLPFSMPSGTSVASMMRSRSMGGYRVDEVRKPLPILDSARLPPAKAGLGRTCFIGGGLSRWA